MAESVPADFLVNPGALHCRMDASSQLMLDPERFRSRFARSELAVSISGFEVSASGVRRAKSGKPIKERP